MKEKLKGILNDKNLDMILITDPYSLRYYTGFRGGEGTAVVTSHRNVLIVDSRYTEAAEKESDFEVIEYNLKNPMKSILSDIANKENVATIGFEDQSIIYSTLHRYIGFFNSSEGLTKQPEFMPLGDALIIPRQIKTYESRSGNNHIAESQFLGFCYALLDAADGSHLATEAHLSSHAPT